MKRRTFILLAVAMMVSHSVKAFNPPTMGWSSWNTFALNINEQVIKSQADAMVATGLDKAGYKFVNIDDGYWDGRGEDGNLRLNTQLFPSGMRSLVDYIHSLGLKAGIYSDAGDNTCGSAGKRAWGLGVGLAGHEERDCKLYFIDWDFDFIKVDYCGGRHMGLDEREQYTKIGNAIRNCGEPGVVFNVCRWAYPGAWVRDVADSWRTTGDIRSRWSSVKAIVKRNLYLQALTGDGHYNDPDMLEIGRTLSPDEENTHMAYWCITSAPLLIGCDLTCIPAYSLTLLKNPDLLAMNQDRLGLGAPVVQRQGEVFVFAKDMEKLMGRKRAVVVTNLSDEPQSLALDFEALGFTGAVKVYDCFSHEVVAKKTAAFTTTVPAHGSTAYFITGRRCEKRVYQAEEAFLPSFQEIHKAETTRPAEAVAADQGAYVGYIGNGAENTLEWRNVYSARGGDYIISLRYASGEPRDLTVDVNGQQQTLRSLNTGDYTTHWQTSDLKVTLRKGYNTVRLSNTTVWAPNVDCMTLRPL